MSQNKLKLTIVADVYVDDVKSIQHIKDTIRKRLLEPQLPLEAKKQGDSPHGWQFHRVWVNRNMNKNTPPQFKDLLARNNTYEL